MMMKAGQRRMARKLVLGPLLQAAGGGGGNGGLFEPGTPLALLQLPATTLQAIGEASAAGEPGVSTIRIAVTDSECLPQHCREVETEAGFVCKKCRLAFPGESGLLAHQRVACYPGKSADSRGAVRLIQVQYECKVCNEQSRWSSIQEFRRHSETEAHLRAASPSQQKPSPRPLPPPPPPAPSPSSAGLSHEMEDVVNQITLLAARAAAENTPGSTVTTATTDSNANIATSGSGKDGGPRTTGDFCHPGDAAGKNRNKLLQMDLPPPPTCSPVPVPSTGQ